MHLTDDNRWSGWTAAGSPLGGHAAQASEADPDAPVGQELLAFLSDFRSGLQVEPVPAAGPVDTAVPGASRAAHAGSEAEAWLDDPYLGSDRQVAPGWWQASDGRWYPPELHPDHQAQPCLAEAVG